MILPVTYAVFAAAASCFDLRGGVVPNWLNAAAAIMAVAFAWLKRWILPRSGLVHHGESQALSLVVERGDVAQAVRRGGDEVNRVTLREIAQVLP